jgi:YYY domain-containing protein
VSDTAESLNRRRFSVSREHLFWLVLLVAVVARLVTQNWDAGVNATPHPDERQVATVSHDLRGWFDDPGFFAYGSLHFNAIRAMRAGLMMPDHWGAFVRAGRMVSLFASLGALVLGWWMARRGWGRRTALLGLALAALVPLDIQLSHYGTVEAHHALWVMAALAAAFQLTRRPHPVWAIASGAAMGASLAVKISSLGLLAPIAVALAVVALSRHQRHVPVFAALATFAGLVAFWVGQPWAWTDGRPPLVALGCSLVAVALGFAWPRLIGRIRIAGLFATWMLLCLAALVTLGTFVAGDGALGGLGRAVSGLDAAANPSFLAGVGEQVRMVMGDADLPYVRIYAGTPRVLYPAAQLVLWGVGPALFVATLWGAWLGLTTLVHRRLRRPFRDVNSGEVLLVLLLAWLVPMTLRLATLQVKYLRYWEPLVVPAALLAAWGFLRLRAPWRRRAIAASLVIASVWGVAYLWAFVDGHPHAVAEKWLETVVDREPAVAWEHWDEHIGGIGDPAVNLELASYELPDTEAKVEDLATTLAEADWVILASHRVRRTVLANPDRYPRTARLYTLLLTGQAGFEIATTAARSPRLAGLRAPVQLADESFVNYEFPRVVVLRRVAEVHVADLVERTARPLPGLEPMTPYRLDRITLAGVPVLEGRPDGVRQVMDTLIWIGLFALLGGACWVLILPLTGGLPDAGAGLALVTGWMVPAWVLWWLSELQFVAVTPLTATLITGLFAGVAGWAAHLQRRRIRTVWRRRRRAMAWTWLMALGVFALFLAVRATNPAIHWGEKPMDFSFLNAFLNGPAWPPGEPWLAGAPLYYYYFGEVLAAFPILVGGMTAAVGYNLMAAAVPALAAAPLAGLGLVITRRRWRAASLVVVALLSGNLAWTWLGSHAFQGRWFDLWWATSRVVPGNAIDEYPLWTALFADLHAHFVAYPVMIAALIWVWRTLAARSGRWPWAAALCGLAVGVLAATNPWDVLVFTGAAAMGAAAGPRRRLLPSLGRLIAAAGISLVAVVPFIVELTGWLGSGGAGRGLHLQPNDFAPWWAVLGHFGVFLGPLIVAAVIRPAKDLLFFAPVMGAGVLAGLSFGSSAAALGFAGAVLLLSMVPWARDDLERLAWALAGYGLLAVAVVERFSFIDRMNTVFKIYNGVWWIFAFALAILVWRGDRRRRNAALVVAAPLVAIGLVNLPLGVAQGMLQPRMVSPRPSLDGQAFLARNPGERFLVSALRGAARPSDVIAEAAESMYQGFTRLAMHTGQPTVVGWDWHLQQRGQSLAEIRARMDDLAVIYEGDDDALRRRTLDRLGVSWIAVGALERTTYPGILANPLDDIPGVIAWAEGGGATLYRVVNDPCAALPEPTDTAAATVVPGFRRTGALATEALILPLRSLDRREDTVLAVSAEGGLITLGADDPPPYLPCEASAAAVAEDRLVALCVDGRILIHRAREADWRQSGRVGPGASGLTAADELWAWGPGGLWRETAPGRFTLEDRLPVAMAAASGRLLAVASGDDLRLAGPDGWRTRAGGAVGVTDLAWTGPVLWRASDRGLQFSGAGLAPWSPPLPDSQAVRHLAGDRTGLVAGDTAGTLWSRPTQACASPFDGQRGRGPGQLAEPRGLALSPDGIMVVADAMNHRLQFLSPSGICLGTVGGEGDLPGAFREPSSVAWADDGRLAVTDTWNGRVQILDADGAQPITIDSNFYGPRAALWLDASRLLVSDTGNKRLALCSGPRWSCTTVVRFDAPPVGLAQVDTGEIAVALPAAGALVLVDLAQRLETDRIELPGWDGGHQQEGYLVALPDGDLLASAPHPGELWRVDPLGRAEPMRLRADLPGLTGLALTTDGTLIGALTWQHRLVRIQLP